MFEPERVRHGVPLLSREDVLESVEQCLAHGAVVQLEELGVEVGSATAKPQKVVALNLAEHLLAKRDVVVALRGAQRVQSAQELLLPLRRLRHLAAHAREVREFGEEEDGFLRGERARSVGIVRAGVQRWRRRRLLGRSVFGGVVLAFVFALVRLLLDLDVVVGGVLVLFLLDILLIAGLELGAHRARLAPLGRRSGLLLVVILALLLVVDLGGGLGLGGKARGDRRGGAHRAGGRARDGILRPALQRVERRHQNRAVRRLVVDQLQEHAQEELLVLAARGDDPRRDEPDARRHAVRDGAVVRDGNRG